MRAARRILACAQPGEGRFVDHQLAIDAIDRQNALLAVAKPALRDVKRPVFQPDACAIAVRNGDIGEDQPVHLRTRSAQDERGLAFAGRAAEQRFARDRGAEGDRALRLDRAFAPIARRDLDRAFARTDRIDRLLQRSEALPGFDHGKGCGRALRHQRGERDDPDRDRRYPADQPARQSASGRGEGSGHDSQ